MTVNTAAHLLDNVEILHWSGAVLHLRVQGAFSIEVLDGPGVLLMRQAVLGFRSPTEPGPGLDIDPRRFHTLARLRTAAVCAGDSAQDMLVHARRIVLMHLRLRAITPHLLLDAVHRLNPAVRLKPGYSVAVQHAGHNIDVHLSDSEHYERTITIHNPLLSRVIKVITRIDEQGSWIPYSMDMRRHPLFIIPSPPATGHARMEHQALVAAYTRELEQDILPNLGA